MRGSKVTVLMSVYNGEKFLHEAIESILNQTLKDFEFLIINDGSTDSSRDIILSYADPRIQLIDNEQNIGLTRTLNKGLKLAKGKYIARMDADDISLPHRLEKQIRYIVDKPEVGVVGSRYEEIDENGSSRARLSLYYSFEEIYYNLIFNNCIPHPTVLFDRKLVLNQGGYNENYPQSQDYELWCRISRATRCEIIDEVLVKHRILKSAISNKFKNQQDYYAQKRFINNIENLLSRKILPENYSCFHEYIYLKEVYGREIIESTNRLLEINEKIVDNLTPNLKIDMLRLKEVCSNRIYANILYLIAQKRFSDLLILIRAYPNKKELIKWAPAILTRILSKPFSKRIKKNVSI